jgi:hypothetical protein
MGMTKKTLVWTLALALAAGVPGAAMADLVTNGGFESLTNPLPSSGKDYAVTVQPTSWTFTGSGLNFIDAPGSADNGSYLSVYGPFPNQSPAGGNFVEADGDPGFSSFFYQQITGLTPGQTYAVSFYQAAGQQTGFSGATFDQWLVGLFNAGESQLSSVMNLPGPGASTPDVFPWEAQTLYFTATTATDYLTFLATGGPFSTSLPPIAFLDGVSMQAVPEPSSIVLFALGTIALAAFTMYRRLRSARPMPA